MNNKDKRYIRGLWEGLSRDERRKKGQRSGFSIPAKLPKKRNNSHSDQMKLR